MVEQVYGTVGFEEVSPSYLAASIVGGDFRGFYTPIETPGCGVHFVRFKENSGKDLVTIVNDEEFLVLHELSKLIKSQEDKK